MTDPIADMLTRIRNAAAVQKAELLIPSSKLKYTLATILQKEGYIEAVESVEQDGFKFIKISLKYTDNGSAIQSIKRVSKPGRKVYCKAEEIPHILNGFGIAVLSTSKGLMTNTEARKQNIGGEIMCEIY